MRSGRRQRTTTTTSKKPTKGPEQKEIKDHAKETTRTEKQELA
jgi:hypothetical protein